MRKLYLLIAFVFLFLIFLALFNYENSKAESKTVCISSNCFHVEIADNPAERVQGLMFRKELNENSGMLFIFPNNEKHSFWMKNTFIPLDIIWIDENLEIVFIFENAQPCKETCDSMMPDKNAKYVLEINARLAEKYKMNVGDRAEIKY